MSLAEALAESCPYPPVRRVAYKHDRYAVAYDGQFWDLLYFGSPFMFANQDDLEVFLIQHGISLVNDWQPEL